MKTRVGSFQGLERKGYSPQEAAYVLGLGRSLTYELIKRGELPAIRVGRRIVVPKAAVDEWLQQRAQQG